MEEELKKKIDEQIRKNNALKEDINSIQIKINRHKLSIERAKKVVDNIKDSMGE